VLSLAIRLRDYLRDQPIAHVITSPADVEFDPGNLVQPDLFVVPLVEGRKPEHFDDVRQLMLAVEVLSPSTARADRQVKRKLYQREGVPEYWIVDVDARLVERWRSGDERPEVLAEQLDWQPDRALPALVIDLPAYFAAVCGE
jgi:Uma2 family endonuclease